MGNALLAAKTAVDWLANDGGERTASRLRGMYERFSGDFTPIDETYWLLALDAARRIPGFEEDR